MKSRIVFLVLMMLFYNSWGVFSNKDEAPGDAITQLKIKLEKDKGNKIYLNRIAGLLLNRGDYPQTIFYARALDSIARKTNDLVSEMYASVYLGQAFLMHGQEQDAKYYLDKSEKQAIALSNDSALSSVYNGLGLYAANVDMDYYRSVDYFFQGIEAAKRSSNSRLYSVLLCNIAGIYYLKKDPQGLKYALECYELGHSKKDDFLIFCGAVNSAYMYFLMKDFENSLKYIKEAEYLMTKDDFYDKTNVYNLYGNILLELGDYDSAIKTFTEALQYKDISKASSVANTYLNFAKALLNKNEYQESIRLLQEGLNVSLQNNNTIYIFELYEYLSKAYERQGDYQNALKYYKTFFNLSDSIFDSDKERHLSELNIKYTIEKANNDESDQSESFLSISGRNAGLLFLAFAICIITFCGALLVYNRKKKQFLQVAVQHQGPSTNRGDVLSSQVNTSEQTREEDLVVEKYSVSSLSDEKEKKLYEELNKLMREEYIYRQNNLTQEKLATLLHTNRTYLSQVINKHTNLSFNRFINLFRIEEAVAILSDPDNDIPLKTLSANLGFKSINTFYSAFRAAVGMTPSLYRKKIQTSGKYGI